MEVHRIVHKVEGFFFSGRLQHRFFLNRSFYGNLRFSLFHNLCVVAVDVSNQFRRGFVDGFKALPKLLQLLAL